MNSNRSTTREWIQRSATAALAATLAVSIYTPSMAHASDKSNTGAPTINTQTGLTAPTTKSFAPKKLGGGVVITRKTKTVKVILKHKQSRKAKLKAYNASAKSWALVSRGKTTSTRAVWKVAPTSTRVKVRVGAMKSGTLTIPGAPTVNSKPNNPTKPNPGTADPTNPPKGKTPPPLSPSDSWDWDKFDGWWQDFKCDYEDIQDYPWSHPNVVLYTVFCDPYRSIPGTSDSNTIYNDGMTTCTTITGTRGLVYEVAYTIRLRDLSLAGGYETNYATWGRSDIRAHDIEPGSAHLNGSGQLAYTTRTRSISPTQDSVTIVLPFYDTEALDSNNQLSPGKPLTAKPEDAYAPYNRDTSPKYGNNVRQILSWVSTSTEFRPATWERDVWGVPGVNGRIPAVGRSQRDFDSPTDIIAWVREHNAAELTFQSDAVIVQDGTTCRSQ